MRVSSYKLVAAAHRLPSALSEAVAKMLQDGPMDFIELIAALRNDGVRGVRHIFNSDVAMALEYLRRRGVVSEEPADRTTKIFDSLRAIAGRSVHLGPCPFEGTMTLVSLYAQERRRLIPVGVLCLSCRYSLLMN